MKGLPISGALALYISRKFGALRFCLHGLTTHLVRIVTAAQATLYIPGFDPQAITADVEGVAADGHTTWRIGPGVTSSPYEDPAGIVHSGNIPLHPPPALRAANHNFCV